MRHAEHEQQDPFSFSTSAAQHGLSFSYSYTTSSSLVAVSKAPRKLPADEESTQRCIAGCRTCVLVCWCPQTLRVNDLFFDDVSIENWVLRDFDNPHCQPWGDPKTTVAGGVLTVHSGRHQQPSVATSFMRGVSNSNILHTRPLYNSPGPARPARLNFYVRGQIQFEQDGAVATLSNMRFGQGLFETPTGGCGTLIIPCRNANIWWIGGPMCTRTNSGELYLGQEEPMLSCTSEEELTVVFRMKQPRSGSVSAGRSTHSFQVSIS